MNESEIAARLGENTLGKYIGLVAQAKIWVWTQPKLYHAQKAVELGLADPIANKVEIATIRDRDNFRAGTFVIQRGRLMSNGISKGFPNSYASFDEFELFRKGEIILA